MIIQIRGTSGTGKTYLVKELIAQAGMKVPFKDPQALKKRKRPAGYMFPEHKLAIIGHYETACGGCDTLAGYDYIFGLIKRMADGGFNVLFEGLIMCGDVRRAVELSKSHPPYMCVYLDTDLDTCCASINERRRVKNPDAEPVNEKNTRQRQKYIVGSRDKLRAADCDVRVLSRKEALDTCVSELLR